MILWTLYVKILSWFGVQVLEVHVGPVQIDVVVVVIRVKERLKR